MNLAKEYYDIIIIGGGFYGCSLAVELQKKGKTVALLEKENDIMQRASYTNQARIHQGYHYPRSILTALRSRINFDKFIKEFSGCVFTEFDKYYAIGKICSKVNAEQFRLFCNRIEAPIQKAPKHINSLFNPDLIEQVFKVREYAFDAVKLKGIMVDLLDQQKVTVCLNSYVKQISQSDNLLKVEFSNKEHENTLHTKYILNCTYSGINQVNKPSNLQLIPLKHELTEMALVEMPDELTHTGFTVMDGPFFSIMPFPARGLHSLSHVRYTPHCYWQDDKEKPFINTQNYIYKNKYIDNPNIKSNYLHMLKDAERYLPMLKDCNYADSIWEIKTILPQSEVDDSRPILFRQDGKIPNIISIMGGKIDNIFDIREKLGILMDSNWR